MGTTKQTAPPSLAGYPSLTRACAQAALSFLAHKAVKINKYRTETCCIIGTRAACVCARMQERGRAVVVVLLDWQVPRARHVTTAPTRHCCTPGNYYSLRGEHEKAVINFGRALTVDRWVVWMRRGGRRRVRGATHRGARLCHRVRNCLSAWTLMGHEFVEMKNTPAATQVYRIAVDINPNDYRAWYVQVVCRSGATCGCHRSLVRAALPFLCSYGTGTALGKRTSCFACSTTRWTTTARRQRCARLIRACGVH